MSVDRFWTVPLGALRDELGVAAAGLSDSEAAARLSRYGPNTVEPPRRPLFRQFADRFANPLVLVLLFASVLSAWTGQIASFAIIVVIITMSVALDLLQQVRAERTVDALRRSVGLTAEVMRGGVLRQVAVETIVPGDLIHLKAGDIVPADSRLVSARDFFVNQSALTGEPYPVERHPGDQSEQSDDLGAAGNAVFMGTSVVSGLATVLAVRTGKAAEIGRLANALADRRPADAFEINLRRFGFLMLRLTVFLVLFVLAANVQFNRPWLESFLFALALAVGLTPELLPMVVTVTLANGAKRLAARKTIVKRLASIHDLGAMDVLCTDKTGTLTEAQIRLVAPLDSERRESPRVLELACLNAIYESGIKSPLDEAVLAYQAFAPGAWQKVDEVPFDFERRRVSVLIDDGRERLLVVKGAPEEIIRLSSAVEHSPGLAAALDDELRDRLLANFEALGAEGYRVLAVAVRAVDRQHASAAVTDETDLVFAGFLTFVDPPKAEAATAIQRLAASGVVVKIVTGDNERITRHVCQQIGLPVVGVLTGQDVTALSQDALAARVETANLFCRLTPQQKERVVLAIKRRGSVVGFLGDGINDAAALRAADVGLSVDTAADVAKEAADIVLTEHDLAIVHDGVLEGRRTVQNVTKYILMGASSNLGNMVSMAGAALFLPFLPMLPPQVLLNNLLYDVSEIGVPYDHVDAEAVAMPVRWDLDLITRFMLVLGPVSSLFDFLTFAALIKLFGASEPLFQTGWFVESLATQSLVVLVIRTRGLPWRSRPHALLLTLAVGVAAVGLVLPLTPLGSVFGFVAPPPGFYLFVLVTVATYLTLVELVKQWFFHRYAKA